MLKKPKKLTNRGYSDKYHPGDIVYWIETSLSSKPEIKWGRVDECYMDGCYVDFLEMREDRLLRPIYEKEPVRIQDYKEPEKFHKLPKGWTYNTPLYEVTRRELTAKEEFLVSETDFRKPETIQKAFEEGLLVKSSTIYHGNIESEITKEGFRIVLRYPMWEHHRDSATLNYFDLFKTYKEACEKSHEIEEELKRQAALSDEEWSKEHIQHTIDRYVFLNNLPEGDSDVQRLKNYLFSLDNIDRVETRIANDGIEWKYEENRKWRHIEEGALRAREYGKTITSNCRRRKRV